MVGDLATMYKILKSIRILPRDCRLRRTSDTGIHRHTCLRSRRNKARWHTPYWRR